MSEKSSASSAASSAESSSAEGGASEVASSSAEGEGSTVSGTKSAPVKSAKVKSSVSAAKKKSDEEVFSTKISQAVDQALVNQAGAGMTAKDAEKVAQKVLEASKNAAIPDAKGPKTGRRLYIMRHAERMDRIFPGWTRLAFTDQGKYRPYDLNQPLTLPKRAGGPTNFNNDTPITEMGYVASQMIGRGMRLNKVNVNAIYASPGLRCVQTAYGLLKTLQMDTKIRVEPGLFEWLAWYESPPVWMSPKELKETGYPIDEEFKPHYEVTELFKHCMKETSMEHYERYNKVITKILEAHPDPGAILVIGHGTSLDASRKVLGKQIDPLSRAEMDRMGLHYPYTSVVAMEEMSNKAWRVLHNPIPSITYLDFSNRINFNFFNRT